MRTTIGILAIALCTACSTAPDSDPPSPPPPMTGEFPGVGTFGAWGHIQLAALEGDWADLNLVGQTDSAVWTIGLGRSLSKAQSHALVAGERVEFDGTAGVGYGTHQASEVIQAILAIRMTVADSGEVR